MGRFPHFNITSQGQLTAVAISPSSGYTWVPCSPIPWRRKSFKGQTPKRRRRGKFGNTAQCLKGNRTPAGARYRGSGYGHQWAQILSMHSRSETVCRNDSASPAAETVKLIYPLHRRWKLNEKVYRPNDKGKIPRRHWLQVQKSARGNFVTWWKKTNNKKQWFTHFKPFWERFKSFGREEQTKYICRTDKLKRPVSWTYTLEKSLKEEGLLTYTAMLLASLRRAQPTCICRQCKVKLNEISEWWNYILP